MMQPLAQAIARRCRVAARIALIGLATTVLGAQIASADESYPSRPIRLIVPFPPGGPTDVMGRLISQGLTDQLGQQVYVDNRPGAGSTLAGKIAAGAEPDGYTLLLGSAATLAIGPTLYRDAEYDPTRFVPVAMVADVPYVMVASPKAPVGSVAELLSYARAHPGKTCGRDLFDPVAAIARRKIAPAGNAVADIGAAAIGHQHHVDAGQVLEPGSEHVRRRAVRDTEIRNRATNAALALPATQAKLKPLEAEPMFGTPADYASFLVSELPKWINMAKLSGAAAE
jgi:tripartite-type tricarboxylate transporter receptor subunit TctC